VADDKELRVNLVSLSSAPLATAQHAAFSADGAEPLAVGPFAGMVLALVLILGMAFFLRGRREPVRRMPPAPVAVPAHAEHPRVG
jgi:hypothetical protein